MSFIDSFQFLSSSLDSLVKILAKDDFKYLCLEINKKLLDIVKQKWFYPYEYMTDFERFKRKGKFYSSLIDKKNSDREYKLVLKVWKRLKIITICI